MDADDDLNILIERLRNEASDVKDCFTRFSFQTIAISTVVIGFIAKFLKEQPLISLAGVLVFILCITVIRIGNHKYATANRGYGYELHLYRLRNLAARNQEYDLSEFYKVGWEEAMRAWRVVQATIFEHLYTTERFRFNVLRAEHSNIKRLWFEPDTLIVKGSNYHSGSYLKVMQDMLYIVAALSIVPIVFSAFRLRLEESYLSSSLCVFTLILLIVALVWNYRKSSARRELIEKGILSIPSCAVMWHIVVLAHLKALNKSFKSSGNHRSYTTLLSLEAVRIKEKIFTIENWIFKGLDKHTHN